MTIRRLLRKMFDGQSGLCILPMLAAAALLGTCVEPARSIPICDRNPRVAVIAVHESLYPGAACAAWALERGGYVAAAFVFAAMSPGCAAYQTVTIPAYGEPDFRYTYGMIGVPPLSWEWDSLTGFELVQALIGDGPGNFHVQGVPIELPCGFLTGDAK